MGGSTDATDLVTLTNSGPAPLVVVIDTSDDSTTWAKYFDTLQNDIQGVRYFNSASGKQVIAWMGSSTNDFNIVLLDASDGSMISSYALSTTSYPNIGNRGVAGITDGTTDYILAAMQSQDPYFAMLGFTPQTSNAQANPSFLQLNSVTNPTTQYAHVIAGSYSNFIVTALTSDNSNDYLNLMNVTISGGTWSLDSEQGFKFSSSHPVSTPQTTAYYKSSSKQYFFVVSSSQASLSSQQVVFGFFYVSIGSSHFSSDDYYLSTTENYQAFGAYASSSNNYYVFLYGTSTNTYKFVSVTYYQGESSLPYTMTTLSNLGASTNAMVDAYITSSSTYTYLSQVSTLPTSTTLTTTIGVINLYPYTKSCFPNTESSTTGTFSAGSQFFTNNPSTVWVDESANVEITYSSSITVADTLTTSYYNTDNMCNTVTVKSISITSPATYYIHNTTSTHALFVTLSQSSCTDLSSSDITYSAVESGSTSLPSSGIVNFDTSTKSESIYSVTASDATTYTIDFSATLNSVTTTFSQTLKVYDECALQSITANNPSQVIYYINDTNTISFLSAFSVSNSYYLSNCPYAFNITNSDLTTIDSNLFTNFDTSTGVLTIASNDTAYSDQYFNLIITFWFTDNDNSVGQITQQIWAKGCKQSSLTNLVSPSISDFSYTILSTAINETVTPFSQSLAECSLSSTSMYIWDSSYNQITDTAFPLVYDSSTNTIQAYGTAVTYIGTYKIQFQAILEPSQYENSYFELTLVNPCASETVSLIDSTIANQTMTYYIMETTTVDFGSNFESSSSICTTYYTVTQNHSSLDSDYFSFDSSTGILTIYNDSSATHGDVFYIKVVTCLSFYPSTCNTMRLYVTFSICQQSYPTSIPSSLNDMNYTIGDTTMTQTFTPWAHSYSTQCPGFDPLVATAVSSGGTSYTLSTSSASFPLTFTNASSTFSVYSVDLTLAGTYTVTLFGDIDNYLKNYSLTFTLTLVDPCPIEEYTLSNTSTQDFIYYLSDTTVVDFTTNLTDPWTICTKNFNFTQTGSSNCTTTNNNMTCYDGSIASFSTSTWKLTLYSTDTTLNNKDYTFTFCAWVTENTDLSKAVCSVQTVNFNYCKMRTDSVNALSAMYFDVEQKTNSTQQFYRWNHTLETYCGSYYPLVATFANGTQIDDSLYDLAIRFWTSSTGYPPNKKTFANKFTVYTTADSSIGSYTITVTGSMSNFPVVQHIETFIVRIQEMVSILQAPNSDVLAPYVITVNDPALVINFQPFTFSYAASYTQSDLKYNFTVNGVAAPSYIVGDSTQYSVTVSPTSNSEKGVYLVMVIAWIYGQNTGNTYSANFTFFVNIEPQNTEPPMFATAPTDQTITAGQTKQYKLGSISDVDGDSWSMSYDLGNAATFTTMSSTTLTMMPPGTDPGGSYPVSITLTDNNPKPMSQDYSFNIIVNPTKPPQTIQQVTTPSNFNPFPGVVIPSLSANATPSEKAAYEELLALAAGFNCWIYSINKYGLVKIQFSDPVLVPQVNLSLLNSSILWVNVTPAITSDPSQLTFNWTVQSFTDMEIDIKLYFDNPSQVSITRPDTLSVTFVNTFYFIQKSTNIPLKKYKKITQNLPKQMDLGGILQILIFQLLQHQQQWEQQLKVDYKQ